MTPASRIVVNGAVGGYIRQKTPTQILELIEPMARMENECIAAQPKRGVLQLENNDANKFEKLQSSTAQVKSVSCEYCQGGHETNECNVLTGEDPIQVNGIWYDERTQQNPPRNQNNAVGNTFNPRWKNQRGLDYKSNHYLWPPPIPQSQPSELERALLQLTNTTDEFMQETKSTFRNQEASIRNLEIQIGQLSRQVPERSQGTFPSDTIINPKEHCNVITTKNEDLKKEEVEVSISKDEQAQKDKEKAKQQPPAIQKNQWDFSQTLEQLPSYAKFLKETLSKKRKLTEDEPVTLTKECSAILQKNLPPKLKDPGTFSILCTIGKTTIEKVLCDLGASINVMPLTLKEKLGINEVKPTRMNVQLADCSTKQAHGIVKNVLVKYAYDLREAILSNLRSVNRCT
ncbi:uncharacterized protein LOC133293432 [Gastrolobium bilobum]|uniref:uncharacterized protein LOC133293432 n=1 Tax=Gastrolobium bilobum TaxID=150636 RepID=UPI002AB0490C|nr:uncharacterized protein LOC133293432 [Gastrolobium bilobum]